MLAQKKSSRFICNKFTSNFKISFTFNDVEDYAMMKFDEKYVHVFKI